MKRRPVLWIAGLIALLALLLVINPFPWTAEPWWVPPPRDLPREFPVVHRREDPPAPAPAPKAPPPAEPPKDPTKGAIVGVALRLDGTPAPGARVRAAPDGAEEGRVVATAGADGSFRIDGLAPGRWTVACGGGGFGTRLDRKAPEPSAEVVAGGEARVEVRAQELAVVAGRVTGPGGTPVAGAKVTVQCDAFLSPEGGAWHLKAETGPDGTYEVKNVTPGETGGVGFEAEGFGGFWKWIHDIAPGDRVVVDVALETATIIDLLLVAEDDGSPVTKAYVYFHDVEDNTLYRGPKGDEFVPDEQGRIHAGSLRPRPVKVQFSAPGFVGVMDVVLDPTKLTEPHTFRLVRAHGISGRLLRADGTGLAGQWVRAVPEGVRDLREILRAHHIAHTDESGAFRIEGLPAGRWQLDYGEDLFRPLVSAVVEAGATDVVLRIPADVAGGGPRSVRVRFADPDGKPVPKARIYSGQLQGDNRVSWGGNRYPKAFETVTLEEGLITVVEIWDARDDAGNRLPLGHVLLAVPRDAPDPWTVTLPPERAVEGTVLEPGDKPVEGARIEIATVPGEEFSPEMSEELGETGSGTGGAFRFGGLGPSDRVRLTPSAEGLMGHPVEAAAGATGVVLRLFPEAKCVLRVLDPDGKPVDANVSAFLPDEDGGDSMDTTSFHTDDAGRVRLRGLEAGRRYRLLVFPQKRPDLQPLRRDDWTPEVADVRLERAPPTESEE